MNENAPILILGAGQAGFQAASSLRAAGHTGSIALVGDEPHLPYSRPPLSKAYLTGKTDAKSLALRPESFYQDNNIDLYLGRRALAVDRARRQVSLDDGQTLSYDHLIFATGARNRDLPLAGVEQLAGVYGLRSLDDASRLRDALPTAHKAVVIGAGFIGLEFAAAAQARGIATTVVELQTRPLARAISAGMSDIFTRAHQVSGVQFKFGVAVKTVLQEQGRVTGVELDNGERLDTDLLLVGIGALPNSELAEQCGLQVAGGILVDEYLRTSDPHISAIGDCVSHPSIHGAGRNIRLESVQNAADQARCVAARLCGEPSPYTSLPWFWSDQGALKLQIAGLSDGHDQVVLRGDPQSNACSVFCFKNGRLVAVESVNRPVDHIAARRLLNEGIELSAEQAADLLVDLRKLSAAASAV